jgi:hypothetical protein
MREYDEIQKKLKVLLHACSMQELSRKEEFKLPWGVSYFGGTHGALASAAFQPFVGEVSARARLKTR